MNWWGAILSGLAATSVLTALMSGSQAPGLTRMSLPFMLGTMFTPDRDLARRRELSAEHAARAFIS